MVKLQQARLIGKKFQNPVPTQVGGLSVMLKALPKLLFNKSEKFPGIPPGPFVTDPAIYGQMCESGLRITWFGHSCLLIEQDGVTLLIDPIWEERASPVQWGGPKRFFAPTLPLADLPPLDAVVISHDHYDHLGAETVAQLAKLQPATRWVTSLKVGAILQKFGVNPAQITELDWTESVTIKGAAGGSLKLTALPGRHFSGRSLLNRFETLWSSFMLATDKHRIYHGVDSGLWDGYKAIGDKYGPFDLALLEIGAFDPLWHEIHLGPKGAVEALAQLQAATLMPVHWGLFDLGLHGWRDPMDELTSLVAQQGISLFQPEPGLPTAFVPGCDLRSDWWRRNR